MLYIKSGYLPVIKIKLDIISEIISHPKKTRYLLRILQKGMLYQVTRLYYTAKIIGE